jgi:GH25 family lysozyme M1 (1,4-beta-N-acetylmuramidase)
LQIDANFRRDWLQAKEENISKGAYHYFIARKIGKVQAQFSLIL